MHAACIQIQIHTHIHIHIHIHIHTYTYTHAHTDDPNNSANRIAVSDVFAATITAIYRCIRCTYFSNQRHNEFDMVIRSRLPTLSRHHHMSTVQPNKLKETCTFVF